MKAKSSKSPISGRLYKLSRKQTAWVHISELANYRVKQVSDIVKEGDVIKVKVIDVSRDG